MDCHCVTLESCLDGTVVAYSAALLLAFRAAAGRPGHMRNRVHVLGNDETPNWTLAALWISSIQLAVELTQWISSV